MSRPWNCWRGARGERRRGRERDGERGPRRRRRGRACVRVCGGARCTDEIHAEPRHLLRAALWPRDEDPERLSYVAPRHSTTLCMVMTLARNVVAACVILVIVSVMWVAGQKHHHQHRADAACAAHAKLDPPDVQRDPTCCSSYRWIAMPPNASIASCAARCCGDDRCETFAVIVEEGSAAAIDSVSALRCERLPCCVLRDQVDELVTGAKGVVTGVRGAAPQQRAPSAKRPTATKRPAPAVAPALSARKHGNSSKG